MQERLFGRKKPFYREADAIQKDLKALQSYQQTFRIDFDDRSGPEISHFFEGILSEFDLSMHGLHYYAWGLPDDRLLTLLSNSFDHTFVAVDTCSFSERQRLDIVRRGLSKPLPTDSEIFEFLATADALRNTTVMLNAVAGLPYQKRGDHEEACAFIRSAMEYRSLVDLECLLLEWQPGSFVSDNPEEFGYADNFNEFDDYANYYQGATDRPRLKFADEVKNERVETEFTEIQELLGDRTARSLRKLPSGDYHRLQDVKLNIRSHHTDIDTTLGKWLGKWRVDTDEREKSVHITRAAARGMEGNGYIEHGSEEARCLIYGNRSRELNLAFRTYNSKLVKGVLGEIRRNNGPKTVRMVLESVRTNQYVSHVEFMNLLADLSLYGFITADKKIHDSE